MSVLYLPLLLVLSYWGGYYGIVCGSDVPCSTEGSCFALRNEFDQLQDFGACRSFYECGICPVLCLQRLEEIHQRNCSLWHICSSNCWSVAFAEISKTLYDICSEQQGFRRETNAQSQLESLLYFCKRICFVVVIYFFMTSALSTTYHWLRQKTLVPWTHRIDIESQNNVSRGSRPHLFSLLRRHGSRNF
ncbi:hypothetical protein GpartN1_g5423.t1 [Galdieria partita]|uniref:Uncharacterized protein n=1 Tax=Galdieria partita TaxID=83374 RepID=A0A9C7Q1U7_9RHOD|nr:hypothetical protein GpartN1_g5423.t1 [Galdieria partita]